MFAKFFSYVAAAENTSQAIGYVLQHVQQWQNSSIASSSSSSSSAAAAAAAAASVQREDGAPPSPPPPPAQYKLKWSSSTSPPVISPFDFTAYGYGSCTAFATLHVYAARAVGACVSLPLQDGFPFPQDCNLDTHQLAPPVSCLLTHWCPGLAIGRPAERTHGERTTAGIPARVVGAPCWNRYGRYCHLRTPPLHFYRILLLE
eukprot:SAG22_NODE_1843_length_3455_cov_2.608760_6_plen_203_part_00